MDIFSPSGCLTEEAMRLFASGSLNTSQSEQVNKHLADCGFCAMAYEGVSLFIEKNSEQDYINLITEVDAKLREKVDGLEHSGNRGFHDYKKRWIWSSVSAAALLLIFLGVFMLIKKESRNEYVETLAYSSQNLEYPEKNAPPPPPPADEAGTMKEDRLAAKKFTAPVLVHDSVIETEDLKQDDLAAGAPEAKEEANDYDHKPLLIGREKNSSDTYGTGGVLQYDPPREKQGVVASESIAKKSAKTYEMAKAKAIQEEVTVMAEEDKTPVFTVVEEMPVYPGGEEARLKFLQENIQYPKVAKESGISGIVYVSFVITERGKITEAKVLKGIGGGCDEEALRVIRLMPRWNPGKQAGKPCRVQFTMPVKFTLN